MDDGWPGLGPLPDGPVELWIVVFADDGAFLGAARAAERPRWRWRGGRLALDYSPVRVVMRRPGAYKTGLICAVAGTVYRPLWPVDLGEPRELRAGDHIEITDGVIVIIPDLPGPHG